MASSGRRAPHAEEWPTRERILLQASRLFAVRGFHGTSTRDIALAVGIRQPSMYSHFASKQEIAEELLRRDLTLGCDALERVAAGPGGPAVELYRYLLWEVRHDLDSPFDLRSLYFGELLDQPEFGEGRRLLARYDRLIVALLTRGQAAGEFIDTEVWFAKRAIDAVILEAIRSAAVGRPRRDDEPDLAASFVLRSLLARPSRLGAVRAAAHRLEG